MAGWLNLRMLAAPRARRRAAFVLLVLAVVAVHGCIGEQIAIRVMDLAASASMPARIEVAYVRELVPSAPPVVVAPRPVPPPSHPPVIPARPASAPQVAAKRSSPEPAEAAATSAPDATVADAADFAAAFDPVEAESWFTATPDPTLASDTVAPPAAATPEADAAAAQPPAPLPPAMPASGATPEVFEWPVSTRISYALEGNYRGEVLGTAQVEWIRVEAHYQVHLDVVIGASFAPIITRRMSSDGAITAAGLAPRRYDEDTRVMFSPHRRTTLHFEPGSVVLANGQRRTSGSDVQDSASQFVQLTYLFSTRPELLRVGSTVRVPLALPYKLDVWTYDVTEAVTLHTSFGPIEALHLVPRRRPGRGAGELSAEIWFAPQLRYLPVRFRIEQDPQTYIELMIARRPQIAGS